MRCGWLREEGLRSVGRGREVYPCIALMSPFPTGDLTRAAPHILTYAYYWYNFMPLARGTAACGYTTILSLFWAAGMPVTASIPKDYQARIVKRPCFDVMVSQHYCHLHPLTVLSRHASISILLTN